jgi:predicted transcriptional regulator
VAEEMEVIDGIPEGIADDEAGRLMPHDEAMARLDRAIEAKIRRSA